MSFSSDWVGVNYYKLKQELSKIKHKEWDDIYHEVLIQFINKPSGLTSGLINRHEAIKYIKQQFYWNVTSLNAPYHWEYNKIKMVEFDYNKNKHEDKYEDKLCIEDVNIALKDIDEFFVYKIVYKDYIKKKIETSSYSINKISIETEIPKVTLMAKFTILKDQIKKIINEL